MSFENGWGLSYSLKTWADTSPTVSIFETVCPWVGLLSNKSKTDLCTRAPFLYAAIRIPPLLVSRKTPRFGLRRLLGLVLVSGAYVSTTIHWKGDSVPLGMAINLISLLWASLHSLTVFGIRSFFFAVYVRSVESGYFVEIVARRYRASRRYCSLFLRVSWFAFLSLDFALLVEGFFGSSPCKFAEGPTGFVLLRARPLSGHRTCARGRPHVRRSPWSFCDRGEMAHPR